MWTLTPNPVDLSQERTATRCALGATAWEELRYFPPVSRHSSEDSFANGDIGRKVSPFIYVERSFRFKINSESLI